MTLYGIAPALMAWQARRTMSSASGSGSQLVPGGVATLAATAAAASGVIVSQWFL